MFKGLRSRCLMLDSSILLDKRSCVRNLRRANVAHDLSLSGSEMHSGSYYLWQKIIRLWFRGEWETCPVWLSFAVCRIQEESLNSAFKQCHTLMKRAHHYATCEKQLEDMRFNQRMYKQKKLTARVIYFSCQM